MEYNRIFQLEGAYKDHQVQLPLKYSALYSASSLQFLFTSCWFFSFYNRAGTADDEVFNIFSLILYLKQNCLLFVFFFPPWKFPL